MTERTKIRRGQVAGAGAYALGILLLATGVTSVYAGAADVALMVAGVWLMLRGSSD